VTLNCCVRGDMTGSVLSIKIPSTKTVAALKKAIKNEDPEGFRGVGPRDLTLYKVSLPYGKDDSREDVLGACTISSLGRPLWDLQKLSDIFMPPPANYQLHLIVGMWRL